MQPQSRHELHPSLGSQVVNTVSTVLVGHLGARDLAAVGLAVSLANVTGYSVTWR